MEIIAVRNPSSVADRIAAGRSLTVALLLLAAGTALGWLALATPLVSEFMPYGRPSEVQVAGGILALGFAIVLPAAFLIMGLARLASILEDAFAARPRRMTRKLAASLGPDHLAAMDLVLPGGRRLHELLLGPFGMVVLGDVPPASISRRVGPRWEIRDEHGRWLPIEDPVQRVARDAERVRGWLATEDRDFLVRVYAAVVTDDRRIDRSPSCAVVTQAELAAWLGGLPPQRGLTPERRERLVAMIRSLGAR